MSAHLARPWPAAGLLLHPILQFSGPHGRVAMVEQPARLWIGDGTMGDSGLGLVWGSLGARGAGL
jgi:hypothetical protein